MSQHHAVSQQRSDVTLMEMLHGKGSASLHVTTCGTEVDFKKAQPNARVSPMCATVFVYGWCAKLPWAGEGV